MIDAPSPRPPSSSPSWPAAARAPAGAGARLPFAGPLLLYVLIAYGFTWLVMSTLHLEPLAAFGPTLAALVVLLAWHVRRGAVSRRASASASASTSTSESAYTSASASAAAPASAPQQAGDALAEWRASLLRWPATRAGRWLSFASPLGFLALALLVVAAAPGDLDWSRLANGPLATPPGLFELLVVGSLLQSLGEEPGWRGWFLPKLRERLGPFAATLVLFPVWLLWHLPMFLARPEFGLPQFAGFALGILSAAVWMTAIFELTRSTLAAIVWHLLINATRGLALAISTPVFLAYGMAVTLGAVAIALIAWRRGRAVGRA